MRKSVLINKLQMLKAEIEWDKSIEYQTVIDDVLKMLGDEMAIPDCKTDKIYNVSKLTRDDKLFTEGYDWCTGVVDNFFFNLDVFYSEDDFIRRELSGIAPGYKDKTYLDLFRLNLLKWIELERNDSIVSMIENYKNEDDADGRSKKED